jgi:hypothetical protein
MREDKAIYAAFALVATVLVTPAHVVGQGLITFINTSATLVRTNSTGLGGSAGYTSINPNGFAYGLFVAPSTVTSLSPLDLLTPTWSFTGVYATNVSGAGRLYGGSNVPVSAWDSVTNSFVVAGWSANVAWTDWNAVAAQLTAGSLNNDVWTGPNWVPSSSGGFFGVSEVGYGFAPNISGGLPGFGLFGNGTPNALGVPISTGWDLFVINVPEPSSFALGVMGALTVAILLRRDTKANQQERGRFLGRFWVGS